MNAHGDSYYAKAAALEANREILPLRDVAGTCITGQQQFWLDLFKVLGLPSDCITSLALYAYPDKIAELHITRFVRDKKGTLQTSLDGNAFVQVAEKYELKRKA